MDYEVWKKWYAEAVVSGNSRALKRLIRIGEIHGWLDVKKKRWK